LYAALERQKRNILELRAQRDELDSLANEVESEQQNYAATLQTFYKTAMESQFNQTNIAVLSRAIEPQDPSSPNVLLNMLSATVLGLILGMIAAVIGEMASPRLRPVDPSQQA
jgi:polysaccharide biosynthesis transport protein